MLWFEGSIAEAIQKSRSTGAYFVVYVKGSENDSKSDEFDRLLETPALSTLLDSEKFVKIQLRLGSAECNQFSQIYPVIVVPSVYFIDQQGTPTEVVGGNVSANAFLEMIQKLIGVQEPEQQQSPQNLVNPPQPESIPDVSQEVKPASEQKEPVPEQEKPALEPKEPVPEPAKRDSPEQSLEEIQSEEVSEPMLESQAGEPDAARPSSPGDGQLSLEAKLEKARQLTEAIRIKKEKEEREKEKRQEVERRETLKNLQKFKKEQEEKEMKELAEQRRKEKEADRLAREKVKKQIEQDRLEKAAKFNTAKNEALAQKEEEAKKMAEKQAAKAASDAAARSENARIQFRFPDGSTIVETFSATSTFAEVRRFLENQPNLPFRNFQLTTTMPRREFGSEDLSTTLRALGLAPSAAILVIPSDSVVQSSGRYGMLSSLVQVIISPLFTILGYIRLFIFGTPTSERRDSTSPPAKKSKSDDQAEPTSKAGNSNGDFEDSAGIVRRRNLGASAALKREGNIHRFVDRPDDDDENNTWNGNSTQQM